MPEDARLTRRQVVERGAALGALLVATRAYGCGSGGGSGSPSRRRGTVINLIANPRAATDLKGWRGGGSALLGGLPLQRVADAEGRSRTAVALAARGSGVIQPAGADPVSVQAGAIVWARVSAKAAGAPADANVSLAIAYRGTLGSVVHPIATIPARDAADWTPLYGFDTVPAGATSCHLAVAVVAPGAAPTPLRVTNAMLVLDPPEVPDYVDGDTPGGRWLDAPNAGPSEGPLPGRVMPARRDFRFGFNDNASQTSHLSPAADVALHREIGSRLLRIGVNLASPQFGTGPGQPVNWSSPYPASYDALYRACVGAGVAMLPVPIYCPPWMGVPQGFPPPRRHFAAWAHLCGELARRWPKAVAIEIWNEPNLGNDFWKPRPDPRAYTELLALSAAEIRRAAPGLPVLLGGVNGIPASDAHSLSVADFLAGVYAAGAKGQFDGLSLHPYLGDFAGTGSYFDGATRAARAVLAANGDRSPLWITETGVSTGTAGPGAPRVSERQQASIDRLLVGILKRQPDVSSACIHTLVAPSALPPDAFESGYEVVEHATGRHKPAFAALRAEARA